MATKQLAEELSLRHEVHVLTTGFKDFPLEEEVNGVRIHRVYVIGRRCLPTATIMSMVTFVPTAFIRGCRLLLRLKFDVINAQFVLPSGVPAAMLSKLFSIPFVLSFIGGDVYDPTKGVSPHRHIILRATIRAISSLAKKRTAISEDTKRRAQELHGVRKDIIVTPIGLPPTRVPKATREFLKLPPDKLVFVSVGRLISRKGYETLLSAWRYVDNAYLVIVGSGHLYDKLKKIISSQELKDRVRLAGFVSEERKVQILNSADGYISAAEHEGFGIVFLEAMEAGLPIVATNEGGQLDFLEDEVNALLVPPAKPKTLAAAINRLANDPVLRQQISENNKNKVKDYYLNKTTALFERVLLEAADKKK